MIHKDRLACIFVLFILHKVMKSQSFYAGATDEHIKHCVDFRDSPSESFYSSTVKESYDL